MLAGMLAIPALADVSAVSVTFGTAGVDNVIAKANANYTIFFTPSRALYGPTSSAAATLPAILDTITVTGAAATNVARWTQTAGANVTVTLGGTATYDVNTGLMTFPGAGLDSVVFTATAINTTGTVYKIVGAPVVTVGGTATIGTFAANAADTITLAFPADTVIGASATASIVATQGWAYNGPTWANANVTGVAFTTTPTQIITATLVAGNVIGAQAQVRINVTAGITNPTTAAAYQLTVATSQDTSAVLSASYNIINPVMAELPGIVKGFNAGGVQLYQGFSIQSAIGTTNVTTITVSAGSYDEAVTINSTTLVSITSTDGAATTFIKDVNADGTGGTVTYSVTPTSGVGVTLDGFTIYGRTGAASLTVNLNIMGTVKNCTIKAPGTAGVDSQGGASALVSPFTFSTVTFDVTGAALFGAKLYGAGSYQSFSSCFFTMDTGGTGIQTSGSSGYASITSCVFTGTSGTGTGVEITEENVKLDTCTFTGLAPAVLSNYSANNRMVILKNSTIDTCGNVGLVTPAIRVQNTYYAAGPPALGGIEIFNNTFKNSPWYIGKVEAGWARFHFNDFSTGNAKGFIQSGGVIALQQNYWGTTTGAPTGFNDATISSTSESNLPIGVAPFTANVVGNFVSAANLYGGSYPWTPSTTAPASGTGNVGIPSVVVTASGAASTTVTRTGAACFTANPSSVAPVTPMTVKQYQIVFIYDSAAASDTATVQFWGSSLTSAAKVFYYNPAFARWDVCSNQVVNAGGGYVTVTFGPATAPTMTDVSGTSAIIYFALLDGVDTSPGNDPNMVPVNGTQDTSATPSFSWSAVAGAIGYDFAIATDSAFTLPTSSTTPTNGFIVVDALDYNTQYWWRVRSYNAAGVRGGWITGTFKTMAEPVVVPTTTATQAITVVVPTQPAPTVTVVNEGSDTPAIPTYLIWVVIAVGAVLVIVVIVLIVRTRRVS